MLIVLVGASRALRAAYTVPDGYVPRTATCPIRPTNHHHYHQLCHATITPSEAYRRCAYRYTRFRTWRKTCIYTDREEIGREL
jgi:hypothetical protein